MRTTIILILLFFINHCSTYGQTNPEDKRLMDSLLQHDDMLRMISNMDKPASFFRLNVGLGNQLYNNANKALEDLQNHNQFIVSPSAEYNHKSGLGVSFTGYLFNEQHHTSFYQYTLSPFYNYTKSKTVNFSVSYTHYFEKDKYNTNSSPVQNESYANLLFKKTWIQPSFSIAHSSGIYHEIVKIDTVVGIRQIHIDYTDTISTHLSSLSFTAAVEHAFEFYNLFSIKDGLAVIPQLSLITGINKYSVNHKSTLSDYNSFTKRQLKRIRNFAGRSSDDGYQLQSAGFDLRLNYGIGKLYIAPEWYMDYYLPQTSDKRLTQIFNFNIGITF